jgi:hypothetical protein
MVSSGRATRRNNPEDTILHSHRRENLKSYESRVNSHPNPLFWILFVSECEQPRTAYYPSIVECLYNIGLSTE